MPVCWWRWFCFWAGDQLGLILLPNMLMFYMERFFFPYVGASPAILKPNTAQRDVCDLSEMRAFVQECLDFLVQDKWRADLVGLLEQ